MHLPRLQRFNALAAPAGVLSPFERVLGLFTEVRRGEGRGAALLATNVFLLMLAGYLLKPVREALVLSEGGAEIRSLAAAGQAVALFALLPAYAAWSRGRDRLRLVQGVTLFFVAHLAVFAVLGMSGIHVGVAFFVWQGVFNVFMVAQLWAFAAEIYQVESGQRLFAVIMVGASLGAFTGSQSAGSLMATLGPWGLMGLAGLATLATLGLLSNAARSVPAGSARASSQLDSVQDRSCGFRAVLSDGYLRLIAVFVILLNLIQTTGDYVLASLVKTYADHAVTAGSELTKAALIGGFYAKFYAWTSVLNIALQLLLVSRIIRRTGVFGALLLAPLAVAVGFGLIVVIPVFAVVAIIQLSAISLNYSVQNTARQALFLPVGGTARFQGKTAIETFFWRFGDLLAAGVVYGGLYLLHFSTSQFALFNAALALAWLACAVRIGRRYQELLQTESES